MISDDGSDWNNESSYDAKIAIDNNGVLHVVWYDYTIGEWGDDQEIMYANNTGSGWSNATVISDDGTDWNNESSYSPNIAVDNNNNLHVVWVDDTDGEWGSDIEIMYANYTAAGWSNATVISDIYEWNNDESSDPDIAIDKNNVIHVVWLDHTNGEWGNDVEIMYANNTGSGWSNATVISDDETGWNDGFSGFPSIAIDGYGNLHVVWHDGTVGPWGPDTEIMYTNYTASGWSNVIVISDIYGWNDGSSYRPKIAIDNKGNLHVVWYDITNGEWGNDWEIMYTNYTAAGWSNATVISDDSSGWNSGASDFPSIATDNKGFIHVVWEDSTDSLGEWGTDDEIMYTRYTSKGWSNATVISDDYTMWNDGASGTPDITTDNKGVVHVVWYDSTDSPGEWGTDDEIMYCKLTISPSTKTNLVPILLLLSSPDSTYWVIPIVLIIAAAIAIPILILYIKNR
ncbi:MAG: hypothetical protein ACFFCM_16440 [Promethearchaeota archaeon]